MRYREGQKFSPHNDDQDGKWSSAEFVNSTRVATIFVYLNNVTDGGHTRFNELGLSIKPEKGMACIHFPATMDYVLDGRTLHEGCPAVDDKWLLATWIWADAKTLSMVL